MLWDDGSSQRFVEGDCALVEAGVPHATVPDTRDEDAIDLLLRSSGSSREHAGVAGHLRSHIREMVTIEDVRELALGLPRSYEALVRDRVKFRVGRIVYLAFSRDETLMGFGFPKEERDALIASEPEKFMMPKPSDQRYHWVVVRLSAIDAEEMREIVIEAWRMVVPKRVAAAYLGD